MKWIEERNDSIIIDTSAAASKRIKRHLLCVICKQRLDNISTNVCKCPQCKNEYFVNSEIVEIEDDFSSSHSDNESIELEGISGIDKPLVLTADDLYSDDESKKSGFYSMDYVLGPGKKIVHQTEEWPQNE